MNGTPAPPRWIRRFALLSAVWLAGVLYFLTLTWLGMGFLGVPTGPAIALEAIGVVAFSVITGEYMLLSWFNVTPRRTERFRLRFFVGVLAVFFGAVLWWSLSPFDVPKFIVFGVYIGVVAMVLTQVGAAHSRWMPRDGLIQPRSVEDALHMVELCGTLSARALRPKQRYNVMVNHANALTVAARAGDPHRRLLDAYQILMELHRSPLVDERNRRFVVTRRLVQVASALNEHGEETALYEQALELLRQEAERRPADATVRWAWLVNRADFLFRRIERDAAGGRVPADERRRREEALGLLWEALPLSFPGDRTELRLRLLDQLVTYVERTGETADLAGHIRFARMTVDKIGRLDREVRPMTRIMLARLLRQRALRSDPLDATALDEAETLAESATESSDADQRSFAWLFVALLHRLRQERFGGGMPAARRSLEALHMVMTVAPGHSMVSMRAADLSGAWAAEHDDAEAAAYGFTTALSAARRLSAMGMARGQKEIPLPEVGAIAAEAMHWQLACGRHREAALALESGRALVLTDMVGREMLVRRLDEQDPALAERYSRLTVELARAELDATGPSLDGMAPMAHLQTRLELGSRLRALRDEWDALADRLRSVPEFRALIDEPRYVDLREAARQMPLLYLAAADRTGHALLITAEGDAPEAVELPGLTRTALNEIVARYQDAVSALPGEVMALSGDEARWAAVLRDTLGWLHENVMGPVTSGFGLSGRVALIPVGPLALLPSHAALAHADPAAAEKITWQYTPNGRVLARHARLLNGPSSRNRVLLTLDEGRDGTGRLRHVPGVESAVHAWAPEPATVLRHGEATRETVLAALPHHDVYHFNCHGRADRDDPFASHLRLADGPLAIRDFLGRRLPGRLAVLSACESAMARRDLPDEVVSLPGALIEAGVPGVIASMWAVTEMPTFLMTARFYELWLDKGLPPADALQRAQSWLRASTVRDFDTYLRANGHSGWPWRYGAASAERKLVQRVYQEPDHWAAFVYTGI
ncbi:CHAT domain-containing protein [Actinomadura soli]|uniref:CHAT domain-containing protein n=1 Tax=Actinomadura soli TaxID=2508997 RepID=A0A5C4J3Y3_9ACTN|nr:CHAT domain-containing protein [Actinomadura soli]TMQ91210.1 CHAT domain-containing protein [Actinomadura soli]